MTFSRRVAGCVFLVVMSATACVAPPAEEDYLPRLAECLRNSGYEVEMQSDGGMRSEFGEQGRTAFMRSQERCEQVIGTPPPVVPLTEAQIRDRYAYLLEMRECLMGMGYTISEPPTEDVFVETWDTGPWSPYLDVPGSALERVEERCPQVPPSS